MLSVIIPTLDAERGLVRTLTALVPASVEGLVKEVIVVDGGSEDRTCQIADDAGALIVKAPRGRGGQLRAGAEIARGDWLLFLHADTVLDETWIDEVGGFVAAAVDSGPQAAAFRFALDDDGGRARVVERFVRFRSSVFGLPYGDQGLLISRTLYDEIGGFRDLPLMEDVDIVRRIGWKNLALLKTRAVTSAARYQKYGYIVRTVRNFVCLMLYFLRVPPRVLVRLYG
ncbi:MAG: TIGR04283 family arsenosugar biosynthesis glycosyltransferase [Hyphomicrobiaceae bacterium]